MRAGVLSLLLWFAGPAAAMQEVVDVLPSGAHIRFAVPDGWRAGGTLLLYQHGFDMDADTDPDLGPLRDLQLAQGYAIAASGYSQSGWALFNAVQDNRDLVAYVSQHFGAPGELVTMGGSMGGLMALKWAVLYPDAVESVILIATNYRHTAQQIALHEVARQAIMSDPEWHNGDYYGKGLPGRGMAVSRMIGHITYMSEKSMEAKFGRKLIAKEKLGYDFSHDFEVENYLKYRGDSFVLRFDANSYLYLSKALDYFDLSEEGDLTTVLKGVRAKVLIVTFTSDWLYPSYQSKQMVRAFKANDIEVSFVEIDTDYGHDSFLVEIDSQAKLVSNFLENAAKGVIK